MKTTSAMNCAAHDDDHHHHQNVALVIRTTTYATNYVVLHRQNLPNAESHVTMKTTSAINCAAHDHYHQSVALVTMKTKNAKGVAGLVLLHRNVASLVIRKIMNAMSYVGIHHRSRQSARNHVIRKITSATRFAAHHHRIPLDVINRVIRKITTVTELAVSG
jgi:hypothetical protein